MPSLYRRKFLSLFFEPFVESRITYALLAYDTAAKTNLLEIEITQRQYIPANIPGKNLQEDLIVLRCQ